MTGPTDPRAALRARAADEDEETRYRAVAALEAGDPGDLAVLLGRLADPSWRVRAAAVERLSAGPGASAAIPGLLQVLAEGPGVGPREAAAAALGRIGGPAVPSLLERLAGDDADLRQATAGILGEVGDRRAVAPLAARLADADPNVRAAAAEALGRLGGAEAAAVLRAAVDTDDRTLRLSALEALGALGTCLPAARIAPLLADRGLRRALYRMLGATEEEAGLELIARGVMDPSRGGREAALGALGQQRGRHDAVALAPVAGAIRLAARADPGLGDAWADALASDEDFVAVGALTALAFAGAPRHAGRMVRLAEDERYRALVEDALDGLPDGGELRAALAESLPGLGPLARVTALAALARLGSPAAFESLTREASDPDSTAQAEAIAALGRVRDARGVSPLAGLLGEQGASAGLAASALVRIGQAGAAARDAVLGAVRARGAARPSAALYRVVGALGTEEDLAFVEAGLRAAEPGERAAAAAAAVALAQRGLLAARSLGGLLVAVGDPAWPVRAAAARAIAEVARSRGPGAGAGNAEEEALRRALGDHEPAVRAAAAEALGACGRAADRGALARLTGEEDPPAVVIAALRALAALGPVPPDAVRRALGHADPEVLKEAVLAAARLPGPEGARIVLDAAASPRWDVRRAAARAFVERRDPALRQEAARIAAEDPDPLVARAFAEAARALGGR